MKNLSLLLILLLFVTNFIYAEQITFNYVIPAKNVIFGAENADTSSNLPSSTINLPSFGSESMQTGPYSINTNGTVKLTLQYPYVPNVKDITTLLPGQKNKIELYIPIKNNDTIIFNYTINNIPGPLFGIPIGQKCTWYLILKRDNTYYLIWKTPGK